MAEFQCVSGQVVLYDDDVVLPGRLSIGSHGYAQCWDGATVVLFHRWVLGLSPGDGKYADHINRNILDCRRENLRVVTATENNLNRAVRVRDLPTGVQRAKGKYKAVIQRHGVSRHLGTFDTPEEALAARKAAEG